MKVFYYIFILFLFQYCSTTVKIPVVSKAPEGFMEFMRGGKDIGIYVYKNDKTQFQANDWKQTIHGAMLNEIQRKGYFRIVDLSSREARLKEVAFSQRMGEMKDISKELSVDGLLFIEVPMSPNYECKKSTRSKTNKECYAYNKEGKCTGYRDVRSTEYINELFVTVYAKARLVNLETGQAKEHSNTKPAKVENVSTSPTGCPPNQEGFGKALDLAAYEIMDKLSPEMTMFDAPIYDDSEGISNKEIKGDVKSALKLGNKWLDTDSPNLELAKNQWEKALSLSDNTSASAFWNLGIYHWSKGDVMKAESHFNKALELGGPSWTDSTKRDVISKFQNEKSRILLEKENEGN